MSGADTFGVGGSLLCHVSQRMSPKPPRTGLSFFTVKTLSDMEEAGYKKDKLFVEEALPLPREEADRDKWIELLSQTQGCLLSFQESPGPSFYFFFSSQR